MDIEAVANEITDAVVCYPVGAKDVIKGILQRVAAAARTEASQEAAGFKCPTGDCQGEECACIPYRRAVREAALPGAGKEQG